MNFLSANSSSPVKMELKADFESTVRVGAELCNNIISFDWTPSHVYILSRKNS